MKSIFNKTMKCERRDQSLNEMSLPLGIFGAIGMTFVSACCSSDESKSKFENPNIIVILADDFGYGDMSCYGATKVKTPEIDKLAAGGMRFTDAYVASSLCSPSRYSLLTGRYSWRSRLKSGVLTSFAPPLIEDGRTTLPSMLQKNGYFTACVGKWHLGFNWALNENAPAGADSSVFEAWGLDPHQYIDFSKPVKGGPVEKGFDYFFGISGANNMIPFVLIENDTLVAPPSVPNNFGQKILRAPNWDLRYLDGKFTEKAVGIIDKHFGERNGNPLFLYFSASAIHRPCLPTFTRGLSEAGLRGDMVLEFDHMVGSIVKVLTKHNQLENTMIIISSDNGPQPGDPYALMQRLRKKEFGEEFDYYLPYFADYQPEYPGNGGEKKGWLVYGHNPTAGLSGFKGDSWEGGVRVPFIVYWPGVVKAGTVSRNVICLTDVMATIAEVTGVKLGDHEGEDSYSFLQNLMRRDAPQVRKSVIVASGRTGALAVRKGEWKYIEAAGSGKKIPEKAYPPPPNEYNGMSDVYEPQLYNLKEDVFERNNLSGQIPEKVSELREIIIKVKANMKSENE
jgi:arylsulfatase A-like enzyme